MNDLTPAVLRLLVLDLIKSIVSDVGVTAGTERRTHKHREGETETRETERETDGRRARQTCDADVLVVR